MDQVKLNFLCISTFFKGADFLKSMADEGHNVYLLTLRKLEHEAWPFDSIKDVFYLEEWNDDHVINGIAYQFRSIHFDRIVALDDFDVEKAASLREYFRIPGMGDTTGRHFRDKLAMRIKAREAGIPVPEFTSLFNDESINEFIERVPAPWLIKPRKEASATGITKVHDAHHLWQVINDLGDDRHKYLVEKFAPGDVYHVDGLNYKGEVLFSRVSKYLDTPFEVAHGGGIFRSQTIDSSDPESEELQKLNNDVMVAFGMKHGASHTEFIKDKAKGAIYFLETSSRVGGANIAEMVEFSSGINLWSEWARIESCLSRNVSYKLPAVQDLHAGIVVSLSRYEHPDTTPFNESELVWRMNKPWHIGLIFQSNSKDKIYELLEKYTSIIADRYHASLPPPESSV